MLGNIRAFFYIGAALFMVVIYFLNHYRQNPAETQGESISVSSRSHVSASLTSAPYILSAGRTVVLPSKGPELRASGTAQAPAMQAGADGSRVDFRKNCRDDRCGSSEAGSAWPV
jgi:hypothetical protein